MKPTEHLSQTELRSHASFPAFRTIGEKPKGPIERMLSVFADVRAGEGAGVLCLMINVLLLLAAYYLLKTAREPLVLTEGGASVRAYSSAGQAVCLMILVPLYGMVGSRVSRLKLVMGLTLFFASHLILFQALGAAGTHIGVLFYIWVGIFNVFVISQFWAFANDIYTESQGKRLFPMIGVGASVGAFAGAQLAATLFKTYNLTPYTLMTLAAVVLGICATLTWLASRAAARGDDQGVQQRIAEEKLGAQDGFALNAKDRY